MVVADGRRRSLVTVGGDWWMAEWQERATRTAAHRREENRGGVVCAILGPSTVILVAEGGGGNVEGGVGQWWSRGGLPKTSWAVPKNRPEAHTHSRGKSAGLIVGERLSEILRALLAEIKWDKPLTL